MESRPLRVCAPRMLVIENRTAFLCHVTDRIDEGCTDLVISMAQTTYVDSSGLTLLLDVSHLLRDLGGRLRVCELNDDLRQLFAATRLDRTLEIADPAPRVAAGGWRAPGDWTAAAAA